MSAIQNMHELIFIFFINMDVRVSLRAPRLINLTCPEVNDQYMHIRLIN